MTDLINPTTNIHGLKVLKQFINTNLPISLPIYKPVQDLNNGKKIDYVFINSITKPHVLIQSTAIIKPIITTEFGKTEEGIHLSLQLFTDEDTSTSNRNIICILLQKILQLTKEKFCKEKEQLKIVQIRFPALPNILIPFISKFLKENNYEKIYQEKCNLWVIDEEKRIKFQDQIPKLQHGEIILKPLSTVEDAKLVNSTWKYRSDESLNKILKIIEDGHPTVGLYVNDKLVSWAVTYPDGASGMLYTLENYRRKGYANIVMQQLFYYRSISNTNYGDPFDYIVVNNTKSENLFKKLNFKPIKKVDWVGYKMCKSKEENNKWDNYFADESSGLLPWENGLPSSVLNNYLINNNKKNHKITSTIRAIDVGCGSGFNTQLLGKYFSHVVGLDISKFALMKARLNLFNKNNSNNNDLPSNVEFVLGNLFNETNMESLRNNFDFLFDIQVFHALRNLGEEKLVKSFADFLVVGGRCMIICGDAGDSLKGEEKRAGPSIVSKFELINAFSPHFDLISIKHGVFDTTASYENFPCLISIWKKRK